MQLDDSLEQLIKQKYNFVKKEYKDFLNSQRFETKNKGPELIQNYSLNYLSTYYAIKEKLNEKNELQEETIKRIYSSAASSEILIKNFENTAKELIYINLEKIRFTESDYDTNLRILKEYTNTIREYEEDPITITNAFFNNLNKELKNKLIKFKENKPSQDINTKEIFGKDFLERRIKKIKYTNEENIENMSFIKTTNEDIIGNDEVKKELKLSMKKLFLYDAEQEMNPALEMNQFKQHYLLEGEPGNGKGMLGAYTATIGKELSQKLNKELKIISFESNSSYQDGPILRLLSYLKEISFSNNLYLVLLDEIDSAFTSRTDDRTHNYQRKLTNELLKFTSNSVDYVNKGNYVMISMTNTPEQLDKAFISRTKNSRYVCEGPKTSEQKITLMKKLLYKFVPENKIKINDWKTIGDAAYKMNLSGRDLTGCIRNVFDKHSTKHVPEELYTQKYETKKKHFMTFREITQNSLLDEILKMNGKEHKTSYI